MKKILALKTFILLALVLPFSATIAEETVQLDGINEPQWKDFVPSNFIDAPEPKGLGKFNETSSYWYKRRVEFENGIQECCAMNDADQKLGCYQQLKVKQYQENSDYNARIEAQEKARMMPQEMYDRTDTMLPIGGYLNNFTKFQPNEFR